MKMNRGLGVAHGKVILIGEHAVVYGIPAIALPLTDLKVQIQITPHPTDVFIISDYFSGKLEDAPVSLDNLKTIIGNFFDNNQLPHKHLQIEITSDLPSERGMGSSAAVATALVYALFDYFKIDLSEEILDEYVLISETIAHGNPSGIDALIVKSEFPYLFKKNTYAKKLALKLPGFLVLADTGEEGQTKEAIAAVATYKDSHSVKFKHQLDNFRQMIQLTLDAIDQQNLIELGFAMNDTHEILSQWGVSNDALNHLVKVARKSGALGAKLTGGGRGGCMIALASDQTQAKKIATDLEKAGAVNTWLHSLKEQEETYDS